MGTQSNKTLNMINSLFVVFACLAVSGQGSPAPGGRRPAPRCRTVYEIVGRTEYQEECSTSYEQQCSTSYETSYEQQCTQGSGYGSYGKQECKQVPKQSCQRVPKENCSQVPVTKQTKVPKKVCSKGGYSG